MVLKELASHLDRIFNKDLALDWDKVGLQIGNAESKVKKVLLTVDISREVVSEAIKNGSDLIIAHHPLIFEPIDTILSSRDLEKGILRLIENRIAVYIAHTNYDLMPGGLNDFLAEKIGLVKIRKIKKVSRNWFKFVIFVPGEAEDKVREALCSHGGRWRNYRGCTFSSGGKGTFIPMERSDPYTGKVGKMSHVDEVRMECIVDEPNLKYLIAAAIKAHPYEEAAYDIYRIQNKFEDGGIGRYGRLKEPVPLKEFFKGLKDRLGIDGFNWMPGEVKNIENTMVSRIAVISGSANSLSLDLIDHHCEVLVMGELNYHNSLSLTQSGKILVELGHGVSESFSIEGMHEKLMAQKEMAGIEISKSKNGFKSWRYYIGR